MKIDQKSIRLNPLHSDLIQSMNLNESKPILTKFSIQINLNESAIGMIRIENLVWIRSDLIELSQIDLNCNNGSTI